MKSIYQIIGFIVWLGLCFATAWFGSRFIPGEWYIYLKKPPWTPPGYVFGPVWTLLYTMMGLAAWLVWRRAGFSGAKLALSIFVVQLVLNGMWSWIFFGMHKPGLALAEILLLWVTIIGTILAFWRQFVLAGVLLIPYLAWVSFAAALNFSIWWMNRGG